MFCCRINGVDALKRRTWLLLQTTPPYSNRRLLHFRHHHHRIDDRCRRARIDIGEARQPNSGSEELVEPTERDDISDEFYTEIQAAQQSSGDRIQQQHQQQHNVRSSFDTLSIIRIELCIFSVC